MRKKYITFCALMGVAVGLAVCSGDPGSPEVHGTVHLASPPSGAATLTVELVPVSAGAGLPIFSLTRALEAGSNSTASKGCIHSVDTRRILGEVSGGEDSA